MVLVGTPWGSGSPGPAWHPKTNTAAKNPTTELEKTTTEVIKDNTEANNYNTEAKKTIQKLNKNHTQAKKNNTEAKKPIQKLKNK